MREGESKGKGAFGRCVIWKKKKQESADNVEGKELIYFTTNFCSEFDSSDFFKPFGISLQPFNILWFPT